MTASVDSTSKEIELEILRILLQGERKHPKRLQVDEVFCQIGPDYDDEKITQRINQLDKNPSSPLNYWSPDEECICLRDLKETGERIDQILEEESDPYR